MIGPNLTDWSAIRSYTGQASNSLSIIHEFYAVQGMNFFQSSRTSLSIEALEKKNQVHK